MGVMFVYFVCEEREVKATLTEKKDKRYPHEHLHGWRLEAIHTRIGVNQCRANHEKGHAMAVHTAEPVAIAAPVMKLAEAVQVHPSTADDVATRHFALSIG